MSQERKLPHNLLTSAFLGQSWGTGQKNQHMVAYSHPYFLRPPRICFLSEFCIDTENVTYENESIFTLSEIFALYPLLNHLFFFLFPLLTTCLYSLYMKHSTIYPHFIFPTKYFVVSPALKPLPGIHELVGSHLLVLDILNSLWVIQKQRPFLKQQAFQFEDYRHGFMVF
jgi:hypothetical protein